MKRECTLEDIMTVWDEIDNLMQLRSNEDYFLEVATKRLDRALHKLNTACNITDEDVELYVGD